MVAFPLQQGGGNDGAVTACAMYVQVFLVIDMGDYQRVGQGVQRQVLGSPDVTGIKLGRLPDIQYLEPAVMWDIHG